MKRISTVLFVLLLLFASCAHAATGKVTILMPGKYAAYVITGVDPKVPLDKKALVSETRKQFAQLGVEQLDYFVYDTGKKPGDGARALGKYRKNDPDVSPYWEYRGEYAQVRGKYAEMFTGYRIAPEDLYAAYTANQIVADEDFANNPVILVVTIAQVAKDASGKPFIKVGVDKAGKAGLQIFLKTNDPFLRRIKSGSKIVAQGFATGFASDFVTLDGKVLEDETAVLLDGKAVPRSEIWPRKK